MNKKDLLFAAIALSVIGLFIFLSQLKDPPKSLASRAEHAGLSKPSPDNQDDILKHNQECLACHAVDSPTVPMPQTHPKKGKLDQRTPCTECHKLPAQQTASFNTQGVFIWPNRHRK
jgi:hypothetical protein